MATKTGAKINARELSGLINRELGRVWGGIRKRHKEVPDAVVLVASGRDGKRLNWGHWARSRWHVNGEARGEVLIAGELLAPGAGDDPKMPPQVRVLEVLLHESAHALADVRGIKDTSREGRYHNERYKVLALELGLVCPESGTHGWNQTAIILPTIAAYRNELEGLREVLAGYRRTDPDLALEQGAAGAQGEGDDDDEKTSGKRVAAVCACPRRFRISRSVLEEGAIDCGVCGVSFQVE